LSSFSFDVEEAVARGRRRVWKLRSGFLLSHFATSWDDVL
jgi:hypothetical protein